MSKASGFRSLQKGLHGGVDRTVLRALPLTLLQSLALALGLASAGSCPISFLGLLLSRFG